MWLAYVTKNERIPRGAESKCPEQVLFPLRRPQGQPQDLEPGSGGSVPSSSGTQQILLKDTPGTSSTQEGESLSELALGFSGGRGRPLRETLGSHLESSHQASQEDREALVSG
ncbi:hypothetical protein H1C71_021173 [Ictidomys tridecemlineatus]|nr:hypothetical protein H1C71_021173 [Ictidomys tridecemlineatus]